MSPNRRSDSSSYAMILLPYLNSYRIPLIQGVTAALAPHAIDLRVFVGSAVGADRARSDSASTSRLVNELKQIEFRAGRRTILVRTLPKGWARADLVILEHAARNLESYVILAWRKIRRRPTALWGHGYTITERESRLARLLQRLMVKLATNYFAYTEGSAVRATSLGARADAVTVLGNTIETSSYTSAVARVRGRSAPLRAGRWVAAYFGGIDRSKRVDFMLEVARSVYARDARFLLIIGGRGELENTVRAASDEGAIEYVGAVSEADKGSWAADIRILLVPGRVGLIAIDSFVLGAPIVTSAWRYHAPEFEYLNERNSIILADDSVPAYTNAILRLMHNDEQLSPLTAGARESLNRHQMSQMVEAYARGVLSAVKGRDRDEHG